MFVTLGLVCALLITLVGLLDGPVMRTSVVLSAILSALYCAPEARMLVLGLACVGLMALQPVRSPERASVARAGKRAGERRWRAFRTTFGRPLSKTSASAGVRLERGSSPRLTGSLRAACSVSPGWLA